MTDYTALLAALDKRVGDLLAENECPDCHGDGHFGSIGNNPDGRLIACEACGGHEDALGSGTTDPVKRALLHFAQAHLAAHREAEANIARRGGLDNVNVHPAYKGGVHYARALTDVLATALEVTA